MQQEVFGVTQNITKTDDDLALQTRLRLSNLPIFGPDFLNVIQAEYLS